MTAGVWAHRPRGGGVVPVDGAITLTPPGAAGRGCQLRRPQIRAPCPQELSTDVEGVDDGVDRPVPGGVMRAQTRVLSSPAAGTKGEWRIFLHSAGDRIVPGQNWILRLAARLSPARSPGDPHDTPPNPHVVHKACGKRGCPASTARVVSRGIPNARAGIGRR